MKYTKGNLKKIEELFKEIEYTIRYEKGSFQSGYCMVENRKIAVINKFFETEARMNTLIEILSIIEVDVSELSEDTAVLYEKLMKSASEKEKEEKEENAESEEKVESV